MERCSRIGTRLLATAALACWAAHGHADVLAEARALHRALEYSEARDLLESELDNLDDEERAEALLLMAALSDKHNEARRFLREAASASHSAEFRRRVDMELAQLDFGRGNYNSVRTRLEHYDDAEARLWVALAWVALQRAERAEAACEGAGSDDVVEMVRAWSQREQGNVAAALGRLQALAQREGDMQPVALLWKAECETELGDYASARESARTLQQRYGTAPEAILLEPTLAALRRAASVPTSPAPTGVFLQIGAFEDRGNALRFRDTLPRSIQPLRVEEDLRGVRRIHRVLVGPFPSREAAEAFARSQLDPIDIDWRIGRAEAP